ncbi:MAG: AEC family transporter [Christensenellales bacterium]
MNILLAFEKVATIFILIIAGFAFGKLTKDNDTRLLSKLVLNVAVPAKIISSISAAKFAEVKTDMFTLMLISVCVIAATLLFCFPFTRIIKTRGVKETAVYRSAMFFNNYGFLGWPVCFVFFGEQGLLYAALYSIPMHLFLYAITPALLSGGKTKGFDKKLLINMPLFATITGFVLLVFGISPPTYANEMLVMVGDTQTPLSMIVIGMMLAGADLKKVLIGVRPYAYSFIRLLLLPAAAYLILSQLGVTGLVLGVSVVITAMPAGTMVAILAQKHGADYVLGSKLVIISTLLSLITIPIISLLVL